ncbi:MAG TPA: ribulose-phosphate 3-epimerase [Phycisphaerae bacterium]|nr:ribulose-phosphate 3-epimerase [Phycisphaerae bacterium]
MPEPQNVRIAPSLLSADFARLGDQIALVERAGAELLHLDVMDGHFVPNLSFGVPVVESASRCTDLALDTHLMIAEPARYAAPFIEAGSTVINFHIETAQRPQEVVDQIRELGARVGVALNPGTPAEAILEIIKTVDQVLVMTVWPGFGGQAFIADCLEKLTIVSRQLRPEQRLVVDGGIDRVTAPLAVRAGADVLVAGSAIFGSADPAAAYRALADLARQAAREMEVAKGA